MFLFSSLILILLFNNLTLAHLNPIKQFNTLKEQLELEQVKVERISFNSIEEKEEERDELPPLITASLVKEDKLYFDEFFDLNLEGTGINPLPPWYPNSLQHNSLEYRQLQERENNNKPILNKRGETVTIASKTPYPPSEFIDINNLTTLSMIAAATVERMGTWYEDGQYKWTAWWQVPVLGMALSGLDHAFGNQANKQLINNILSINNKGNDYIADKYVDDQSWWAMFAMRAYQTYGTETWLQSAKFISSNNTIWWTDQCGGGVLWLTYVPNVKNTVTNALYFSILARLYRYTGDPVYYQYAVNTLNWWLGWGFESTTGRVYDTITYPDCNPSGLKSYTYNSGSILFGLADLYYASGNTTLLDLGRTIAYGAMRDFTVNSTGVLQESCEHDAPPTPLLQPGCQQDEIVFKGILTLGMAELYLARADSNIYNFINTQLLAAVFNDLDDTWLFGQWWVGPWNGTTAGPKTQVNSLCMLAAAAQINSAFITASNAANSTGKPH